MCERETNPAPAALRCGRLAALPLLIAYGAATTRAQGDADTAHAVSWPRPVVLDPSAHGIVAESAGNRVVGLRLSASSTGPDLVFKNPVQDWQVGEYPDRTRVVLAGGVRESLDIYQWDPVSGQIDRYETRGGRRLPEHGFGAGLGSWPLRDGRHLSLFAFESEGRVHVRAWGAGRVLAARVLPGNVTDCEIFVDDVRQLVRVEFPDAGADSVLGFVHPLAPRLTFPSISGRVVEFTATAGEPARASIVMQNGGVRRCEATLVIEGDGFVLAPIDGDATTIVLDGGAQVTRDVVFTGSVRGEFTGRLSVESPLPSVRAAIVLRARVVDANARVEVPAPAVTIPRADPQVAPAGTTPAPLPAERSARRVLTRDDIEALSVVRTGPAVIRASGRIGEAHAAATVRVRVRVGRSSAEQELAPDGAFDLQVAGVAAGEVPQLAVVGAAETAEREIALEPIAAAVLRDGDEIAVCVGRFEEFLLAVFAAGDERRPLRVWRASADGSGVARIPVGYLGHGTTPLDLVAVTVGSDGLARRTAALRHQPPPR